MTACAPCAVMLDLLCHMQLETVGGGFTGINIFFVISGFLISLQTAIALCAGLHNEKTLFSGFYVLNPWLASNACFLCSHHQRQFSMLVRHGLSGKTSYFVNPVHWALVVYYQEFLPNPGEMLYVVP